jgi:hypothetical protein
MTCVTKINLLLKKKNKKHKQEKKMKVDEWPSEATSSVRVELPLGWARLRKVASHSFVGG